ncbi:MAG: hypothetical protein ACI9DG_000164, partial [Oleispira sp.]
PKILTRPASTKPKVKYRFMKIIPSSGCGVGVR